MKTGVLVHVYHLDAVGWDELLWGDPATDRLGSMPTLAWLMLTESADAPVETVVIGCGPAVKDGLNEAAYTKRAMLQRFDRLGEFPRLKPLLETCTPEQYARLRARFETIIEMPEIQRTLDEISVAAEMFTDTGAERVVQICSASHAPRCAQILATSRLQSNIPADQIWSVMPTDICFNGAVPADTAVFEPPHRGDDPMLGVQPGIAQVLKPYHYALAPDKKIKLIGVIDTFIQDNGRS